MEGTARQSKKQRRQQLKQDIFNWLAQQPDRTVLETEFRSKVGRLSDVHALFASRDFAMIEREGKRWITAQTLQGAENEDGQIESVEEKKQRRMQLREKVLLWLAAQPDQTATLEAYWQQFGVEHDSDLVVGSEAFVSIDYQGSRCLQSREYHEAVFRKGLAEERRAKSDLGWQKCVSLCGDVMRPDGTQGKSPRLYVIARTYTAETAAKRLGFAASVMRAAAVSGDIPSFIDPDGKIRIPAAVVEQVSDGTVVPGGKDMVGAGAPSGKDMVGAGAPSGKDMPGAGAPDGKDMPGGEELLQKISGNVRLKARQISIVAGISYSSVQNRLRKMHITSDPLWKQVRGQWGLPNSLKEFNAILEERYPAWLASVKGERSYRETLPENEFDQTKAQARAEANQLRQQLIEVFPTWDQDRSQQHITLHLGPTNSGKTFSGLNNLAAAGSGWYLSPLRLLAHEVFETLNKRGVPCSLLTGEESIEVPGAQIIAATIEMFNPRQSGKCIIIDEAHMLADDQRGWAWTRAIMEAAALDIHIVGSPVSELLINRLAEELGFAVTTERYERLTPLHVAETPWTLEDLPARTILVAFSRKMVLGLKSDLEKKFNRSVAVVYGNLPPEVRLRQAERFSSGKAEICVATDAIGMGLNLPADNVCFYEVEKFDGKQMRVLNPNEIKQIAGRAGRFGLSELGMVGALSKPNLNILRQSIEAQNTSIGYAYIAPEPESLALLPGTLEEKLGQWMMLNGIPQRWRRLLKPVDLSEQITLAGMLTPANVKRLGEETALHLISAPCANNTEPYWLDCAKAIIARKDMPIPDGDLPRKIVDSQSLESYELMIRCADIYLWLAQRREFARYAPDEDLVRAERRRLSEILDDALAARIDTTRRCRSCGRPMALSARYNICDRCFRERRF